MQQENFVLQIETTVVQWLLCSPLFSTGLPKCWALYYLLAFIFNSNTPGYYLAENNIPVP